AVELIAVIDAQQVNLVKTHVIRELDRNHRDRVSLPAPFGEIREEPASQTASCPEKRHVAGEIDHVTRVPADEFGHRKLLDIPGALLDDQVIRDDVVAGSEAKLIEHQIDPIRAEGVFAIEQRKI